MNIRSAIKRTQSKQRPRKGEANASRSIREKPQARCPARDIGRTAKVERWRRLRNLCGASRRCSIDTRPGRRQYMMDDDTKDSPGLVARPFAVPKLFHLRVSFSFLSSHPLLLPSLPLVPPPLPPLFSLLPIQRHSSEERVPLRDRILVF